MLLPIYKKKMLIFASLVLAAIPLTALGLMVKTSEAEAALTKEQPSEVPAQSTTELKQNRTLQIMIERAKTDYERLLSNLEPYGDEVPIIAYGRRGGFFASYKETKEEFSVEIIGTDGKRKFYDDEAVTVGEIREAIKPYAPTQ